MSTFLGMGYLLSLLLQCIILRLDGLAEVRISFFLGLLLLTFKPSFPGWPLEHRRSDRLFGLMRTAGIFKWEIQVIGLGALFLWRYFWAVSFNYFFSPGFFC